MNQTNILDDKKQNSGTSAEWFLFLGNNPKQTKIMIFETTEHS